MLLTWKKEPGGGWINYASYFAALMLITVIFAFRIFEVNLYLTKDILDNAIHIVEGTVIASNHTESNSVSKLKIVTTNTYQNDWDSGEKEQVNALGREFQDAFIDYLKLENYTHPGKGPLANLCGKDSDVLIAVVTIYEPIYDTVIIKTDLPPSEDEEFSPSVEFGLEYTIIGWVNYTLEYTSNQYSGCKKSCSLQAPILHNGSPAEGATIEATVGIRFKGVEDVFAAIEGGTPEYTIQVTQAVDLVLAKDDSRTQN